MLYLYQQNDVKTCLGFWGENGPALHSLSRNFSFSFINFTLDIAEELPHLRVCFLSFNDFVNIRYQVLVVIFSFLAIICSLSSTRKDWGENLCYVFGGKYLLRNLIDLVWFVFFSSFCDFSFVCSRPDENDPNYQYWLKNAVCWTQKTL